MNEAQTERLGAQIAQAIQGYNKKVQAGENAEQESQQISSACKELDALVTPPQAWTSQVAISYNKTVALCLLLDLNIFQFLSETDEPTTLDTLVKRSGASRTLLRSALGECVAQFLIDEPAPDTYQINSRSNWLLHENGGAWINYLCDVGLRTGAYLSKYVTENAGQIPDHEHQTAFQMAYQTDLLFYPFFRSCDKNRAERFDKAMQWVPRNPIGATIEKIFGFDQLKPNATVVDVGGGKGHHAIRIAKQHPNKSFIVQDVGVNQTVDPQIPKNVQWQTHDFNNEQPVKGADVYFLSAVLMDNTPEKCRKILGHITDAMTPNESFLLINDIIYDETQEYHPSMGTMHMHLLACHGTLPKTTDEWKSLFTDVKSDLVVVNHWSFYPGRTVFALKRVS